MSDSQQTLFFYIDTPPGFFDGVSITVANGVPDEAIEAFTKHLRGSLRQWYDGANVYTADEWRERMENDHDTFAYFNQELVPPPPADRCQRAMQWQFENHAQVIELSTGLWAVYAGGNRVSEGKSNLEAIEAAIEVEK